MRGSLPLLVLHVRTVYTCELAGVDPKTIRTFAIKAVTVEDNTEMRKKLHSFL